MTATGLDALILTSSFGEPAALDDLGGSAGRQSLDASSRLKVLKAQIIRADVRWRRAGQLRLHTATRTDCDAWDQYFANIRKGIGVTGRADANRV